MPIPLPAFSSSPLKTVSVKREFVVVVVVVMVVAWLRCLCGRRRITRHSKAVGAGVVVVGVGGALILHSSARLSAHTPFVVYICTYNIYIHISIG